MQHHKYSLSELEDMIPWERNIYISLLVDYLKKEKERLELQQQMQRAKRQMADVYDKVGGFIADKVKSSFKDTLKGAGKSLSGAAKSITGGSKTQQIGSDNKPVPEKPGNKLGGVDSTLMNINQSLQSILSSSSVLPTVSKEIGLISKKIFSINKNKKKTLKSCLEECSKLNKKQV